ncbi:hypothetical protein HKBW3S44_01097, partial [Candidatus Hakubella thermalkaliphila]
LTKDAFHGEWNYTIKPNHPELDHVIL